MMSGVVADVKKRLVEVKVAEMQRGAANLQQSVEEVVEDACAAAQTFDVTLLS